jgi:hypothetical protein
MNFTPNGECSTFVNAPMAGTGTTPRTDDTVRYGQDPFALDARGLAVGLATTQCGRTEQGIPAAVQAYCATYGETLLEGWGKRQGEWQLGIGVQHEILPRLSIWSRPTSSASAAIDSTARCPSRNAKQPRWPIATRHMTSILSLRQSIRDCPTAVATASSVSTPKG